MAENVFLRKRLNIPGLKPSDYFLFKSGREYFGLDSREILVLGLRWIYAGFHEPRMQEMILALAESIHKDDLDYERKEERPEYLTFQAMREIEPRS